MSAAPLVRDAARGGRAIVGFNVFSLESMSAVIRAGKDAGVPVIVTFNEADLAHVGIAEAVAVTRLKADAAGADVVLHLDHGMSLELAGRCISAGFTSVMIDTARYPRERRVEVARRVVDTAHAAGVSVESMLGTLELATAGEGEGSSEEELTDPGEAGSYSGLTGIDMLAVSVGSKHGSALIGEKVVLDMERLSAISRNVDVPLVVHGGSAVEEAQLRQLRTLGVGKMNIGSALRIAYRKSLAAALAEPRLDVRDCHARAGEAIYEAALQKIRVLTL